MANAVFHLSETLKTLIPVAESAKKVTHELNSLASISQRLARKLPEEKRIDVKDGSELLDRMSDRVQTVAAPLSNLRQGLRN